MYGRGWFAVAAAVVLALAGCTAAGAEPHTWGSSYDYGTPGAVAGSYASVGYYPACHNEALSFNGHRWFPFEPANVAALPADPLGAAPPPSAAADAAALAVGAGPVGAVGGPGPGDDVGTLVIYENGLAYWESDSGDLKTWLTNHEIEYNWAC